MMPVWSYVEDNNRVLFPRMFTCLIRVSNSTPFLATNPAVLSTMFFTSGGGWMIGISASATIFTPEMFQHVTELFSRQYYHKLSGVHRRKPLLLQEALQRLPMPRRAGRKAAQRRIMAALRGRQTKSGALTFSNDDRCPPFICSLIFCQSIGERVSMNIRKTEPPIQVSACIFRCASISRLYPRQSVGGSVGRSFKLRSI